MGSFTQWLKSTTEEIGNLRVIEDFISRNNEAEARAALEKADLTTLIKYTELSKSIKDFSNLPSQDSIWLAYVNDFNHEEFLLKLYNPLTPSQLIKGMYFYWQATECRAIASERFQDDEVQFLHKSAENNCFHAYNSLSTMAYEENKRNPGSNVLLALAYAKQASTVHWTPGYLLLYKTYLNLAILNENNLFLYTQALEAILMAKKLSEFPESIAAVNNAYFGKGIIHGNQLLFSSWDKAIANTISDGKIPFITTNSIFNKVVQCVKNIPRAVNVLGDEADPSSSYQKI